MRRVQLFLLALVVLALSACEERSEPLPELVPISDFTLTNQAGEDFGTRQLRGKVWIADLIFTRCPDICPVMSSTMANLHRRIDHEDVRFVSITVDPDVDTPEVLRTYAARYHADTSRWTFLTGAPEDVRRVILRSFRLPVEPPFDRPDGTRDVLHTSRFILVGRNGVMRGLYETDRESLERLEADVDRLLEEAR